MTIFISLSTFFLPHIPRYRSTNRTYVSDIPTTKNNNSHTLNINTDKDKMEDSDDWYSYDNIHWWDWVFEFESRDFGLHDENCSDVVWKINKAKAEQRMFKTGIRRSFLNFWWNLWQISVHVYADLISWLLARNLCQLCVFIVAQGTAIMWVTLNFVCDTFW